MDIKKRSDSMTNKLSGYFHPINNEEKYYKCEIENCDKKLCGKAKNNLVAHVKRKHKTFFEENFGSEKYNVFELPIKRLKYIQNCVEIVAVNGHAFTILAESGVKNLMQNDYEELRRSKFSSGLGWPNYPAIKNHIKYLSGVIIERIKGETRNKFIGLMADSATKYRRSILGLSIQYIHCGQLKIRTIGMINMTVSQSAENLMNAIINRLKFYGIEMHQILAITTDNANAMTAMINRMNGRKLNDVEGEFDNGFDFADKNDEEDDECVDGNGDDDGSVEGDDDDDNTADQDGDNESRGDEAGILYKIPDNFFDMSTEFDSFDNDNRNDSPQFEAEDDGSDLDSDDEERHQTVNAILDETIEFERLLKDLEKRFSIHTLNINGIRCAVHTLQLAIRDALKETGLNRLIKKCREICKLLRKGKLRTELMENNISIPVPNLDCKTRWNSIHRMVRIEYPICFRCFFYVENVFIFHVAAE